MWILNSSPTAMAPPLFPFDSSVGSWYARPWAPRSDLRLLRRFRGRRAIRFARAALSVARGVSRRADRQALFDPEEVAAEEPVHAVCRLAMGSRIGRVSDPPDRPSSSVNWVMFVSMSKLPIRPRVSASATHAPAKQSACNWKPCEVIWVGSRQGVCMHYCPIHQVLNVMSDLVGHRYGDHRVRPELLNLKVRKLEIVVDARVRGAIERTNFERFADPQAVYRYVKERR